MVQLGPKLQRGSVLIEIMVCEEQNLNTDQ